MASLATAYGSDEVEKPLLSFGLLADVQYADVDPEGERHYRESPAKLREAVVKQSGGSVGRWSIVDDNDFERCGIEGGDGGETNLQILGPIPGANHNA